MTERVQFWLTAFLCASAAMSLLVLIIPVSRNIRRKRDVTVRFSLDTVWVVSLCVLGAVWALRYAVGYYRIQFPADRSAPVLTWFEEIFNSVVHALQTFSMDEDYTDYITDGRAMMQMLTHSETWENVYGAYAAVLNLITPILGGAVLFDILLSFLPKLKLRVMQLLFWKHQYYFSELNERALALAQSLCDRSEYSKHIRFHRPLIVFTDAYTDKESEESSELLDNAKALGAICLRDDLLQILRKPIVNFKKEYLLIDINELNNIKTLAEMASETHWEKLRGVKVRIFYQDDSYSLTERQIIEQFIDRFADTLQGQFADPDERRKEALNIMPAITRVRGLQHMVYQLLRDCPLYRPLLAAKNPPKELKVGIIGCGGIGMEMLLASAWFGQMTDTALSLNVVTLEEPEVLLQRIGRRCPELLHSATPGDPVLRIYPDAEEYGERYFTFRCAKADVMAQELSGIVCTEYRTGEKPEKPSVLPLTDCDYYLVSTGSDDRNIEIAEQLRRAVHIRRMQCGTARTESPHVMITYVVYDSDLSAALNRRRTDAPDSLTELRAVGAMRDIYSRTNILLRSSSKEAEAMEQLYRNAQKPAGSSANENDSSRRSRSMKAISRQENEQARREMKLRRLEVYSWMADNARAMHLKYKLCSVCWYLQRSPECAAKYPDAPALLREVLLSQASLFGQDGGAEGTTERSREAWQLYGSLIRSDKLLEAKLTWLEHRRWNAYMRTCGFVRRDDKQPKDLQLRLHPTLVETKTPEDELDPAKTRKDYLDAVSEDFGVVYKKYDYPLQ